MRTLAALAIAALCVATGCVGGGSNVGQSGVRITPPALTVPTGDSVQVYAGVYSAAGDLLLLPDVFTPGDGKFWSVTNMNGGSISADGQFSGGQPGTYPQLIALTYIHGGAGIHQTVYADVVVTE